MKRILFLLCMCAVRMAATPIYTVTLDTTPLTSSAASPFYVDFQLNGTLNNTVMIDQFGFGAGSAAGSASCFGGCSGDLSSSVTLTDNPLVNPSAGFTNEFFQAFTPGNTLSFRFTLPTTVAPGAGGTPDGFSFAILDSSLTEIPMDPSSPGAFLNVTIDSPNPTIATYTNDPNTTPSGCGAATSPCGPIGAIAAPMVQAGSGGGTPSAVPEPSSLVFLATGIALCLAGRKRAA